MKPAMNVRPKQSGFLMLEVLIALFILLIGLVGLAGLQARAQQAENESYQRLQALMLLRDMVDRINANRANAASYVTGTSSPLGYGNTLSVNCAAPSSTVETDQCQWNSALIGAAETSGGTCNTSTGANCVGAVIRARGCVENLGGGATGPFLVTVAWQGLVSSAAPPTSVGCGSGSYGDDTLRRAVTTVVQIADLS
jgi:type IV pilus assembly protein PilV